MTGCPSPFFYLEVTSRMPEGRNAGGWEVVVRCANKGYGHKMDPVMARAINCDSLDDALVEIRSILPTAEILGPEEYLDRLTTFGLPTEDAEAGAILGPRGESA